MSPEPTGRETSRGDSPTVHRDVPSLLLSALLLVMGVTVLVDAAGVEAPPGGGVVGPAAFMWAIGGALVVLGALLAVVAMRGRADEVLTGNPLVQRPDDPDDTTLDVREEPAPADGPAKKEPQPLLRVRPALRVAVLVAGLLVHAAVISTAGYIVAAALLFIAASLAFGAPRLLPVVLIGTVLATVIFYSFTQGLGLGLPYLGGSG